MRRYDQGETEVLLTKQLSLDAYLEVLEQEKYRRQVFDDMIHDGLDHLLHELTKSGPQHMRELLERLDV
tara:strand:- start:885 stop:1091 length:207 start_codon:yes stop_codon:yes gene_type:complete